MTEAAAFLDVIKNIMVIACLCATLCATCRQEQASDRINAQILSLEQAAVEFKQVAATNDDQGGAE